MSKAKQIKSAINKAFKSKAKIGQEICSLIEKLKNSLPFEIETEAEEDYGSGGTFQVTTITSLDGHKLRLVWSDVDALMDVNENLDEAVKLLKADKNADVSEYIEPGSLKKESKIIMSLCIKYKMKSEDILADLEVILKTHPDLLP